MTLLSQNTENRKHIVLINPPNKKIVLRDLYSSTISKGTYNWPNIDLLSLSATLSEKFLVSIIDANTLKYSIQETVDIVFNKENLAGIVVSIGKSVIDEDYKFTRMLKEEAIKKNIDLKIGVVGGIIFYNAENEINNNLFIDACILNFTTEDACKYFSNELSNIKNIVYREDDKVIKTEQKLPEWGFKMPIAQHSQLPLKEYQLSHGKNTPLASVLTSYGCPHKCSFCVSGKVQYRYRDPDNILEELKYLQSIGVKEINFKDNIFGFHKKSTIKLLEGMIKENMNFSWVSDSRLDILDEEIIKLMSQAGCHALHFGIESFSEETLSNYDKNLKNVDYVSRTLNLCKKYGVLSVGYFILGLPGESYKDVENTINYALELNVDYASFNLPYPIVGTELRETSIKEGWLKEVEDNYDGSLDPLIITDLISKDQLIDLKRKAYKKFYFRLSFIIKKLLGIRTFFQIRMLYEEGMNLIFYKSY